MAELVDALASGASSRKGVGVQISLKAQIVFNILKIIIIYFQTLNQFKI